MVQPALTSIWRIYSSIQVIFGDFPVKNRYTSRILKLISNFLLLSVAFMVLTVWYSFCTVDLLSEKIYFGSGGSISTVGAFFVPTYMAFKDEYYDILAWCEDIQQRFGGLRIFKQYKRSATNIYRIMIVFGPIAVFFLFLSQWTVLSLTQGKVVSPLNTEIPMESNSVMFFLTLYQILGVCMMMFGCGAIMGLIFVMLYYFMATLEHLQEVAKNLEGPNFQEALRDFVGLHCEVREAQEKLARFAFVPTLVLEAMTYSLLIYTWIVAFFIHEMIFLAASASGTVIPYIMLCWVHEKFLDEYDKLRETLHSLDWTAMDPKQRKLLLPLLVMVDYPKHLKTGPFHIISYEEMGNVFNRVYSVGLCLNNYLVV